MPLKGAAKLAYMKKYRARPEVKKRQALYMREWFLNHRKHCLEYQRRYRKINYDWQRPQMSAQQRIYMAEYRKRPYVRVKDHARYLARYAVKTGRLKKGPCEVCGRKVVHAHHDDYRQPLRVRWLCQTHHSEQH